MAQQVGAVHGPAVIARYLRGLVGGQPEPCTAKQLKIDRSFVNDLEFSSDARAIVDAVIRLAHALGPLVVAEGVETAGQRDALLQLDCDELGLLFRQAHARGQVVGLGWQEGIGRQGRLFTVGRRRRSRSALGPVALQS